MVLTNMVVGMRLQRPDQFCGQTQLFEQCNQHSQEGCRVQEHKHIATANAESILKNGIEDKEQPTDCIYPDYGVAAGECTRSCEIGASHDCPERKVEKGQHHCPSMHPIVSAGDEDGRQALDLYLHGVFVAVYNQWIDLSKQVCRAHSQSTGDDQRQWEPEDALAPTKLDRIGN